MSITSASHLRNAHSSPIIIKHLGKKERLNIFHLDFSWADFGQWLWNKAPFINKGIFFYPFLTNFFTVLFKFFSFLIIKKLIFFYFLFDEYITLIYHVVYPLHNRIVYFTRDRVPGKVQKHLLEAETTHVCNFPKCECSRQQECCSKYQFGWRDTN